MIGALHRLVLAAIFAALMALGFWQLERLAWKRGLIAQIEANSTRAPRDIYGARDLAQLMRAGDAYAPFRLHGRFAALPTQFWFTPIANPPANMPREARIGYHALQVFQLAQGGAVLIDRGFLPAALLGKLPVLDPAQARVIEAVLRWPPRRTFFDPKDRPQAARWYVRDPRRIGAHLQTPLAPVLFEATRRDGGYPLGGQTRRVLPNNHLNYALTWFGLAAAWAGVFTLRQLRA